MLMIVQKLKKEILYKCKDCDQREKRKGKMTAPKSCYGCEGLHFKADYLFKTKQKKCFQCGRLGNRQSHRKSKQRKI